MLTKIDPGYFQLLFLFSVFTFLLSLVLIPWLVSRLPDDYFVEKKRKQAALKETHPVVRLALLVLKNVIGGLLLFSGIFMLIFPGQGLLTILLGLGVMDFPGKFTLERKLVSLPGIMKAMNWVRKKAKVSPLIPPVK